MATGRRSPVLPVLLFGLFCAAALWGVLYLLQLPVTPVHGAMLGYLTIGVLMLHLWQERALGNDPQGYVRRFMTGLVLKMLMTMLFMGVMMWRLPREERSVHLVAFVLLYLAFLGFSTARSAGLLRGMRRP